MFDEVIKEFLVESYENLDQLDSDLVALEDAPDDRERLASIFRTVHTIKGTSGFLALPKLERVAHVGENLLVPLRDGDFELNPDIADALLGMVDAIRVILENLESQGGEGENDFEPLVGRLKALLDSRGTDAEIPADSVAGGSTASSEQVVSPAETVTTQEASESGEATASETAAAQASEIDGTGTNLPDAQSDNAGEASSLEEEAVGETPAEARATPVEESTVEAEKVESKPVETKKPSPPPKHASMRNNEVQGGSSEPTERPQSHSVADATVRIDVEILDKLMNLVGELVLSRNQILQFCSESEDSTMIAASQRLNLITTELQEGVMKTRMQPIRNAWSKLPRVVRDLSASCGKKVEVRMEGADTELDKTILEAIKDPLTHIVRNSVDHGIESPEVRAANGKPAEGTLLLRAFHEGGQVNIEIVDDGGGINVDRVREKAMDKGLVSPEQAASMSDRELTNLILLPGFSTAAKVTNVSGRGVGMDVVKTNIEKIGGTLDIQSTPGGGTTLRIKIPLTLAIVPALIVKTGLDAYAIPQVGLLELVRLDGKKAQEEIEYIHDVPVYRLRENLLPLVYLDEQLGLRPRRARGEYDESINIVVLQAEDRQFGLVVDAVTDTQEIVVKPLGQHLKSIPTYAGATIMGDGTVALILDVIGLAQKSSVLTEHRDRMLGDNGVASGHRKENTEALLIVNRDDGTRAAIRLSTVARLEEFDMSKVEQSGQNQVVQYRGEILPLISLSGGYGGFAPDESGVLSTVVYDTGHQRVGIVVGKIIDIVHQPRKENENPNGRKIIHDRVTEVIELEQLVRQCVPDVYDEWSAA